MPKSDLAAAFTKFFSEYLLHPEEEALVRIAEIGRNLVETGIPPEEIGELFETALKYYAEKFPEVRLSETAGKISVPLVEMLIAYGLAFRQQNEQQQTYEKTRLASKIMENSPDGIWMADSKGRIQTVNPAFSRITAYESAEVMGKNVAVLHGLSPDDIVMEKIWEIIRKDGIWKGELASRRKNGEVYPALLRINTIRDHNENIVNYIGVLSDISEKHKEENIRLELDRAKEIYNLVVQPRLPEIAGIEINAKCIPAENIGGDIMEIIKINEKKLVVFLADITGHGVSAAMTANTLKMLFREISESTVEPSKIFRYLNNVMYNNILPDDMIAAFCGCIDLENMEMNYCLNGLPNPFIFRDQKVHFLKPTGYPLGVFKEMENKCLHIPLFQKDLLVLYTDGISEVRGEGGRVFGNQGIENSVSDKKHNSRTIVEDIFRGAENFQQKNYFSDDIIILAINIYDENTSVHEARHTSTYRFPTRSVCKGKTKFLFIDEVVGFFLNYISETVRIAAENLGGMKIALFELLLNAIEHGNLEMTQYKNDPDFYDSEEYWKIFNERMNSEAYGNRQISIECNHNKGEVEIIIEDSGPGFDVETADSPLREENVSKPSGRGIALAKMNVDRLLYNAKGNTVRLIKQF